MLVEQHDEWTEQRRYLGLDILAKSRLRNIAETTPETAEVTIPAIIAQGSNQDHAETPDQTPLPWT